MAGETDKKAVWGISIRADSNANEAATAQERLLQQINRSQEAVKSYQSSLSKLRGSSDEVKAAKEKLKAAVEGEKEAISRATLALDKMGTTYAETSKAAAKAKAAADKNSASIMGLGITWTAAGELIASALKSIASAVFGALVSLAKFIPESANALRTMGLFREAATGSAENAKAFGHQIDALGDKIPTSREELNKLSIEMSKSLVSTRVSGQGIVDTFNAVAQASAAMGDSTGKAIGNIIERGKMLGRIGIGFNELQGTGIAFQDVAQQLSKNLGIGINEAQMQLRMGRVKIDAGAKALREVVEKRFGGINARRMLDLNVMATKFRDNLQRLTEDVDLEPILGGFEKMGKLFSQNTVTGRGLKQLVTAFGEGMGKIFKVITPLAEKFFKQLIIESLKLEVNVLRLNKWLKETFGADFTSKIDLASTAITAAKVAFGLLAAGVAITAAGIVAVIAAVYAVQEAIKGAVKWVESLKKAFDEGGWGELGSAIISGLVDGFKAETNRLLTAVSTVADGVKNAFKKALGIHSPSKVFEGFGKMTGAGFEKGVEASSSGASGAAERMVTPPSIAAGGKSSGGGSVSATVNVHFPNVKDGEGVKQVLAGPEFKAAFLKVLEDAMRGAGSPIMGGS